MLEQLDSVPEWVEHIETVESLEGRVRDWYEPSGPAVRGEFCQTVDQDGRVCLAGGPEIGVHAEMKAERPRAEPNAAARRKMRRLGLLNQAENARIEVSRDRFLPGRHCQLNVIEAKDLTHRVDASRSGGITPCGFLPRRFGHKKLADRQASRRLIMRCESDARDCADVDWGARFGVGRLKKRIRTRPESVALFGGSPASCVRPNCVQGDERPVRGAWLDES